MEQPIPQGCRGNEALQDLTFVPTSFSACFPHTCYFIPWLVSGRNPKVHPSPTKKETEALGHGFLESRTFLRTGTRIQGWNSNSRTFSSTLPAVTNESRFFLRLIYDSQIENQGFLHISISFSKWMVIKSRTFSTRI